MTKFYLLYEKLGMAYNKFYMVYDKNIPGIWQKSRNLEMTHYKIKNEMRNEMRFYYGPIILIVMSDACYFPFFCSDEKDSSVFSLLATNTWINLSSSGL